MEEPPLTPNLTALEVSMQSTAISRIVGSPHAGRAKSQLSLASEPGVPIFEATGGPASLWLEKGICRGRHWSKKVAMVMEVLKQGEEKGVGISKGPSCQADILAWLLPHGF